MIRVESVTPFTLLSCRTERGCQHSACSYTPDIDLHWPSVTTFTSVIMARCCRILRYSSSSPTLWSRDSDIGFPSRHKITWHLPTLAAVSVKQPLGSVGSWRMWHSAAEPPSFWPAVPSFLQMTQKQELLFDMEYNIMLKKAKYSQQHVYEVRHFWAIKVKMHNFVANA